MAFSENKPEAKASEKATAPETQNFIDRISYYEHLTPEAADNDNQTAKPEKKESACFDSWALPDYMRS